MRHTPPPRRPPARSLSRQAGKIRSRWRCGVADGERGPGADNWASIASKQVRAGAGRVFREGGRSAGAGSPCRGPSPSAWSQEPHLQAAWGRKRAARSSRWGRPRRSGPLAEKRAPFRAGLEGPSPGRPRPAAAAPGDQVLVDPGDLFGRHVEPAISLRLRGRSAGRYGRRAAQMFAPACRLVAPRVEGTGSHHHRGAPARSRFAERRLRVAGPAETLVGKDARLDALAPRADFPAAVALGHAGAGRGGRAWRRSLDRRATPLGRRRGGGVETFRVGQRLAVP